MKDIRIKKLTLTNFKCHGHLRLDLDGKNVDIYGDNASGKTSIYDALTWLLFGKSSKGDGDKNFEVKPLGADGEVDDHNASTEVEAVFSVDGETVSLCRTLHEIWATKRGSSVPVFDGNTSDYFIDGVPVKKGTFADKVSELVDESAFKLLTNVSHFADGIGWQERRAVLFKAAGVASDREIMAGDVRFAPLLEAMGKLEIEDYKKKLLAEKRGHSVVKNEIPARISECEKTISDTESIDFDAIRSEVDKLSLEADAVSAEMLAIEHSNAAESKRLEIRSVELALDELEAKNRAYRASQVAGAVNVTELQMKLTDLTHEQARKESRITMYAGQIASYDKEIAQSREQWISENAVKFSVANCPTCGQALPAAQLKAAQERFDANKEANLHKIEQIAKAKKQSRGQAEEHIAELREEHEDICRRIEEIKAQIAATEANKVEVIDLADYESKKTEINYQIKMLSGELADIMTDSSDLRQSLSIKLSKIRSELIIKRNELGCEAVLEYSKKRIAELREDARRAAELLEGIDSQLFLIDEFSRYKAQFVEDSVNNLFRIARFRLFREQTNGGLEERCDVVFNGVPYSNLNSGARINVGIDIINTLSVIYGVRVPLFVDNAESVTALEPCASQTIRLVVSQNDRKLRIEI